MRMVQPNLDLDKMLGRCRANDGILFWDVKLVRGEDTGFCQTSGTISLPEMLAPHMLDKAPLKLVREMILYIIAPLVRRMMEAAEANPSDFPYWDDRSESRGSAQGFKIRGYELSELEQSLLPTPEDYQTP